MSSSHPFLFLRVSGQKRFESFRGMITPFEISMSIIRSVRIANQMQNLPCYYIFQGLILQSQQAEEFYHPHNLSLNSLHCELLSETKFDSIEYRWTNHSYGKSLALENGIANRLESVCTEVRELELFFTSYMLGWQLKTFEIYEIPHQMANNF